MIEAYFDFRLYRLWKTRQHSKLLDYEDFLWQRHLDQWCSGALQCHEEPVKTDPAFEHCSAVVLGPPTRHKQSYPRSPLRGWEKREGNSRPRGWRWIKLCCASALPRFQKERSPTNREKRPNQHKRGGGERERAGFVCIMANKSVCLLSLKAKSICQMCTKEIPLESHSSVARTSFLKLMMRVRKLPEIHSVILWFCVLTGPPK